MHAGEFDRKTCAAHMTRRRVLKTGFAGTAGLAVAGLSGCSESAFDSVAAREPGVIDRRLAELSVTLPEPTEAVATYAPFRVVGDMVYVAGQGPAFDAGTKVFGKLGADLTIEEGANAARLTGLSVLAQAKAACGGDLDRIVQWVRLTGYVNSADDFVDQPKVINGASDLLVEIFGEKGLHARAAVGVNALPFNIAVEIEASFQIRS